MSVVDSTRSWRVAVDWAGVRSTSLVWLIAGEATRRAGIDARARHPGQTQTCPTEELLSTARSV
ncbi:hypothetical protein [Micromonospora sp. NPDC047738]|uniref:hypothetical protein n=1 Tax=unclassified Micromonospora TaxID=2617518 RepID=UPI003400F444